MKGREGRRRERRREGRRREGRRREGRRREQEGGWRGRKRQEVGRGEGAGGGSSCVLWLSLGRCVRRWMRVNWGRL